MKKNLFILSLIAVLSSCSSYNNFYQICKVSSPLETSSDGAYEYSNSDCKITYDFWADGGAILFEVKNNTNDILYLDLTKSFIIKNGFAYDYFLNRTTTTSSSSILSKSASATGVALGYWNVYGKNVPGSIAASATNSVGTQKSTAISFEEKPIVAIPPQSSKIFREYYIMNDRYTDCDLYESPSKKEVSSMSFVVENSPMNFVNYMCYRVGDNGVNQFIQNEFYVSSVSNKHRDAVIQKVEIGCESDLLKTKKAMFIHTSPKEFYIEYQPRDQKKKETKVQKKDKKYDDIY